jgi:hypothetical protein
LICWGIGWPIFRTADKIDIQLASLNGEFLGYVLTYQPVESPNITSLYIRDESLKTQVNYCKVQKNRMASKSNKQKYCLHQIRNLSLEVVTVYTWYLHNLSLEVVTVQYMDLVFKNNF